MSSKNNVAEFPMGSGLNIVKNGYLFLKYYVFKDSIHIDKLEIEEEFRSKGHGTKIMQKFLSEAQKTVTLVIVDEYVMDFYLRLGFEIDSVFRDGNGKIYDADMVWEPKGDDKI